jgi:hypothetical protein
MQTRLWIHTLLATSALIGPVATRAEAGAPSIVEVPVAEVILLESVRDESFRILLSFPDLDGLSGKTVVSARLMLPTISVEAPLRLQARAVACDWSAETVSWTTPWTDEGGDYRQGVRASCLLRPDREASSISINITSAVTEIVENGEANFGFLLLPDAPRGTGESRRAGIPSALRSSFSSLDHAKLLLLCAAESETD